MFHRIYIFTLSLTVVSACIGARSIVVIAITPRSSSMHHNLRRNDVVQLTGKRSRLGPRCEALSSFKVSRNCLLLHCLGVVII
jgi:hypothetical protein